MLAPNKNRGVTYQTDGNHLGKTMGHSVGEVKIACFSLNNRLLLRVFTNNHRKYLSNRTSKRLVKCYVHELFGHPGLHHTIPSGMSNRDNDWQRPANPATSVAGMGLQRPAKPIGATADRIVLAVGIW
jgi:hypothetical protein